MNALITFVTNVVGWLTGVRSGSMEPGISMIGVAERVEPFTAEPDNDCPFFVADEQDPIVCCYCGLPRTEHTLSALAEL